MKYTAIMSDKQTDRLDAFTSKMVKESPQEKPSINFSKNVMDAIYELEAAKELKRNQPLISNKIWVLFVGVIAAATIFLFNNTSLTDNSLLSKIDLSNYINALSLDISLGFSASNITIYGFVFFAMMVSIQIGYIKNYYSNKFD